MSQEDTLEGTWEFFREDARRDARKTLVFSGGGEDRGFH